MPWQERDWAKWTEEERNRFLGTSGNRGGGSNTRPPAGGYRANQARRTHAGSGLHRRLGKGEAVLALAAAAVMAVFLVHHVLNEAVSAGMSQGLVPAPNLTPALPSPNPATASPPAARVPAPEYRSINLRSSLPRGTYVTSSGTLGTNVNGPILVEARWGAGPWYRLASANVTNGAYRVRYLLDRPGLVHLRVALPDGNYLVGTVRVN